MEISGTNWEAFLVQRPVCGMKRSEKTSIDEPVESIVGDFKENSNTGNFQGFIKPKEEEERFSLEKGDLIDTESPTWMNPDLIKNYTVTEDIVEEHLKTEDFSTVRMYEEVEENYKDFSSVSIKEEEFIDINTLAKKENSLIQNHFEYFLKKDKSKETVILEDRKSCNPFPLRFREASKISRTADKNSFLEKENFMANLLQQPFTNRGCKEITEAEKSKKCLLISFQTQLFDNTANDNKTIERTCSENLSQQSLLDKEQKKVDDLEEENNSQTSSLSIKEEFIDINSLKFVDGNLAHEYSTSLLQNQTNEGLLPKDFQTFPNSEIYIPNDPLGSNSQEKNVSSTSEEATKVPFESFFAKNAKRIHTCMYCPHKYASEKNLKEHMKLHTGLGLHECCYCSAKYARAEYLKLHIRTHTGEKPFSCPYCPSKFTSKPGMEAHKRIHTGEKPYVCDHCSTAFRTSGLLLTHTKRHLGLKDHVCSQCPAKFIKKSELAEHFRIHTGEKPYSCNYCESKFRIRHQLTMHLRRHTKETPFFCSFCPAKFSAYSSKSRHERTHTGVKPYKCNVCLAEFNQDCSLKRHLRTHTGKKPYKCDCCSKRFSQKNGLETHAKSHSGETLYSCEQCSGRFNGPNSLKKHLETCGNDVRFSCEHCSATFTHKRGIISHLKIHKI